MASTWRWYSDPGLTAPLTRADFVRDATAVAVDRRLYFGSSEAGKKLQCVTDPGADQLQIAVTDATSGAGVEVADVVLSLSAAGLDSATPGAALDIGTTLYSGVENRVEVFVRLDSALIATGDYDGISIGPVDYVESSV